MATDESTSSCSEAESKCNASVLVAGSQSFVDNVTSLTLLTDEQNVCSAQVFSTVVYDACDTPVACDANPATVAAILETEGKIHNALRKMLINIKKLPDDIVDELLKKFVLMYRYSFERCINLPPPEGLEGEEPLAALRHHLSFRLDQWNEWHGDKGIDRLLGRNFTDPNGENKARMGDDEAAGLQQMKERVMGIEKERMIEAEKKKKELMMSEAKILNEEQAKKLAKAKKSEERRLARAERTKKKKWQKEIEFLKAVTLEQVVGNVPLGVLKIYKAKCHLCEDRLTDAKYLSMHVKIRHPAVYFCHYCDRTFASHGPLRVHCEVLHPGVPIDPEGRRPPERANCTNGSIQTSRNLADDERGLISMMRGSTTETEDDEQDLAPVLTPASDLSNDVRRMFESKMSMEYGDAGSKDEQSSPLMSSMPQLEAMEHGSRESDIRGSSLPPIHTELEAAMELSQLQIHGAMYKERGRIPANESVSSVTDSSTMDSDFFMVLHAGKTVCVLVPQVSSRDDVSSVAIHRRKQSRSCRIRSASASPPCEGRTLMRPRSWTVDVVHRITKVIKPIDNPTDDQTHMWNVGGSKDGNVDHGSVRTVVIDDDFEPSAGTDKDQGVLRKTWTETLTNSDGVLSKKAHSVATSSNCPRGVSNFSETLARMKAFALYRELNECGPNETEESISAEVEESSTTDLSYSNESIMRIPERASDIFDQLKKKVLECQANKHEEIHLEKKEARRKPHRRSKTQFQSRAKAQMMIAEKAHENCPSKLSTGKKRALNVCEEEDVAGEQNFDEASITSESINETKSSAKRRHSVKSNKKIVEEPINEVNENRVSIASDTTSDITGQNLTTRTSQLFGQLKANALHRMRSSMKVTGKKIVTGSNPKTKSNHSSRRRSAVHKSKESLKSSVCQR